MLFRSDGDTAQVGPEISEWLNIPSVSNVRRIVEVKDDSVTVEMDMMSYMEISEVKFPCLLTVEKDIFQPRLPSYIKKKNTEERPIKMFSLDNFNDRDEKKYGLNGSPTQVQRIFPPERNNKREIWDDSGDVLADKLYQTVKELKFI